MGYRGKCEVDPTIPHRHVVADHGQDVANSYATSVSSRSLTLVQAGVLAVITEFIGAIALGQQVTATIRSGVFSIKPFLQSPGVLLMANVVAEVGMLTQRRPWPAWKTLTNQQAPQHG